MLIKYVGIVEKIEKNVLLSLLQTEIIELWETEATYIENPDIRNTRKQNKGAY